MLLLLLFFSLKTNTQMIQKEGHLIHTCALSLLNVFEPLIFFVNCHWRGLLLILRTVDCHAQLVNSIALA